MDVVNFPAIIANKGLLKAVQIIQVDDLILIGKKVNSLRDGSQYEEMAITVEEFLTLAGVLNPNDPLCTITLAESFTLSPIVNFVHPSGVGPAIFDTIGLNVQITRNLSGWLYNPLFEAGSANNTPTNTLWYYNPSNLSQVKNLSYDTLQNEVIANLGSFSAMPGTSWAMHDTFNNKYYYITFNSWASGGGDGGFEYDRQEVTDICDGCVHFSDGTRLCTAPYTTIEDEGVPLPQRTTIDYVGAGVTVTDVGGKTQVNIPGGGSVTIPATNYYIDVNFGNDGTALPNRFDLPYKTITAANNAAVAPATIHIRPGTYTESIDVKTDVEFYFEPGCILNGSIRDLGVAATTNIRGYLRMTLGANFNFTGTSVINAEIDSMTTTVASAINLNAPAGLVTFNLKVRLINATIPSGFSRFINIDRTANFSLVAAEPIIVNYRLINVRNLHNDSNIVITAPSITQTTAPNAQALNNQLLQIDASGSGSPTARTNITVNADLYYTGAPAANINNWLIAAFDGNWIINGNISAGNMAAIVLIGTQGLLPPPAILFKVNGDITSDQMCISNSFENARVLIQQGLIQSNGNGFYPVAIIMGVNNNTFFNVPNTRCYFKDCRIVNTNPAALGVVTPENAGGGAGGKVYLYNCEGFNVNAAGEFVYSAGAAVTSGFQNVRSNVANSATVTDDFVPTGFITDINTIIPQF